MTDVIMFVVFALLIIACVIGLAVFAASERYARAILCAVALVIAVLSMTVHLIGSVEEQYTDYANRCHEHGGVIVNMGGSMNCQGSDGRFIDVRW